MQGPVDLLALTDQREQAHFTGKWEVGEAVIRSLAALTLKALTRVWTVC